MRIDGQAAVQKLAGVRPKSVGAVEETAGTGVDSMELSTRAADIRTAMEALTNAPEVRQDRVVELSRQLEQGTLSLDANSLAEKLLQRR